MRLIDADRINFYKATVARGMHSFDNVEIVEKFQIDRMPTIDPESLRTHGRWVCVNLAFGRYECSVCHAADEDCSDYYGAHNVNTQDFCPYCGAKMDGGKTDDAK